MTSQAEAEVKWSYGKAWERFPIEQVCKVGGHVFAVADHHSGLSRRFLENRSKFGVGDIDLCYVDPPWTQSNESSFRTKAGFDKIEDGFEKLMRIIIDLSSVAPVVYMEMGFQKNDLVQERVKKMAKRLNTALEPFMRKS